MKRTLRDILIGIVLGICIVFGVSWFLPDVGSILHESLSNISYEITSMFSNDSFETEEMIATDGEEIDEDEVIDSGISGDGYSFSETMNAYYALLNEEEKQLYAQMYANADSLQEGFEPCVNASADTIEKVFQSVLYDHPEMFWIDNGYSYKYVESGEIVEIDLKYNETVNDLENAKAAFDEACNAIIWTSQQYASDEEKERYVHDTLIDMIDYDINASLNQSAYSGVVNHSTVCAGYAKSFQYIMNQLGIPCYYVVGTSQGEEHAWNIIYINGVWRNVDLTWDDAQSYERHMFFNLSDEEMQDTHTRSEISLYLPACQ